MRGFVVPVLFALCLGPRLAAASEVVRSTCPALEQDPELLAAFEARALAELALRNPAIRLVQVSCDERHVTVQVRAETGKPRAKAWPLHDAGTPLVDQLLAAVWELAPEPAPAPTPAPPKPLTPSVVAVPSTRQLRLLLLGRLGLELWSGPPRGVWGPDVGLGVGRGPWSATVSVAVRWSIESPPGMEIKELGAGGMLAFAPVRPLELGVAGNAWRVAASTSLDAKPKKQVAWTSSWAASLRLKVAAGPVTFLGGPQLVLRLPRAEIIVDGRRVAELPLLAGGLNLELCYAF